MFPLTLKVTPETIAKAKAAREQPDYWPLTDCLVAQAAKEAGSFTRISCGFANLELDGQHWASMFKLPWTVERAIRAYVARTPIKPFECDICPHTISINVTQEMIERAVAIRATGNWCLLTECLMATAIKQCFPGVYAVCGVSHCSINGHYYQLDPATQEVIRRFTGRKVVEPFTATVTYVPANN